MSDFDGLEKPAHGKTKKPRRDKNLCLSQDCGRRWTHSDGAGVGYCGLHYYWNKTAAEREAWRERDDLAQRNEADARQRKPRYPARASVTGKPSNGAACDRVTDYEEF